MSRRHAHGRRLVFVLTEKIWGVDPKNLPEGAVVRDGVPDGHVSVSASPEQIRGALTKPYLLQGLKRLEDGTWRLPK